MDIVIEAGAEDLKAEGDNFEVTTDPSSFEAVKAALEGKSIEPTTAEVTMIPNSTVKVEGNDASQILALMEALEDQEDVQAVYANFDISDEEMEKISQ